MLGFLKENLFNIICGVVSIASIGLGVFGVTTMAKVTDELENIRNLHGQFAGPTKKPINDKSITAEQKRVETIERYYKALMTRAKEINAYDPILPPEGERFFPKPTDNGRRQFKETYEPLFIELIEVINAGEPPDSGDIQEAQEAIDEELRAAQSFGEDEELEQEPQGRSTEEDAEEEEHPSGLITEKSARESAATRASIRRARSIYCYAERSSFDENPRVYEGLSPRPFDMWQAQVSFWVQQDVVAALARVNNEAADKLKAEGKKAWVGVLPVKDLISIRVSDYLPVAATMVQSNVRGDDPAFPPGKAETVFTKNNSNDLYEVVQFSLKMVIDARDLPLIIDEICKDRFHTLLNMAYVYERNAFENLAMEGKIYGSEPTIKVVMDFETIFFGEPYRCQMPEANLGAIGKECTATSDDKS